MKPFLSLMLAAAVGCVIAFSAPGSQAQEQERKGTNLGVRETIQGACVVGTTDNQYVTLHNPTVSVLGDRLFLVGPQVDDDQKLNRDITKILFGEDTVLWIPVDSITVIGQIPMDE